MDTNNEKIDQFCVLCGKKLIRAQPICGVNVICKKCSGWAIQLKARENDPDGLRNVMKKLGLSI